MRETRRDRRGADATMVTQRALLDVQRVPLVVRDALPEQQPASLLVRQAIPQEQGAMLLVRDRSTPYRRVARTVALKPAPGLIAQSVELRTFNP